MARANSKEHIMSFVLAQPNRLSPGCLNLHKTLNSHTYIYDDKPNNIYRERVIKKQFLSGLDLDEWIAEGVSFMKEVGDELYAQNANRLSDAAKVARDALLRGVSFDLGERISKLYRRVFDARRVQDLASDAEMRELWRAREVEACEALFAIGINVAGYVYQKKPAELKEV